MEKQIQKIYRQSCPAYFPTIFSQEISNWIDEVERLFKQPIKNVFPYPMDIIKVFNKDTGKLKCLKFQIALAGLNKDELKVQLKDKKYLTISVRQADSQSDDSVIEEYVNKGISYRDSEITFRIFQDVDLDKFKPLFRNGLLTIELFVKESIEEPDIINAEIN